MTQNEQRVMGIYNRCINRKREGAFAVENDGRYFVHTDDYLLSCEALMEIQRCFDIESISIGRNSDERRELMLVVTEKI